MLIYCPVAVTDDGQVSVESHDALAPKGRGIRDPCGGDVPKVAFPGVAYSTRGQNYARRGKGD